MTFKKGDRIVSNGSFCRGAVWIFERAYNNQAYYVRDSEGHLFWALKEWGWELADSKEPTIMDSSEYEDILSCQAAFELTVKPETTPQ